MSYRSRLLSAIALFFSVNFLSARDNSYHFSVDLVNIKDHKIQVSLIPPDFQSEEVVYHLPSIVPGTYSIYDFGRFVSDFIVSDAKGNSITADRIDINSWKIPNAATIRKITYWVEDTWNTPIRDNFVFEPGGSNVEKDKNFIVNTHCFFRYFEGYKRNTFHLEFSKPQKFYGSTSLVAEKNTATIENYSLNNYVRMVDSPIMFCVPDTTTLSIGGAKILISVYSSKKSGNARLIADNIGIILKAQKDYLGGRLPIDKYAFIIYMFDGAPRSGSYGALEHSYSSFYVLPEMEPVELAKEVRDFAAHEFFHIITPLSIHSEEIGNFDFNHPVMSRHLWLYEGVTEYFAGNVQVMEGLMKPEDYLEVLHGKINGKEAYNDTLPFTKMSLGCLQQYKDQYDNVYQKGALIGMCLDIELRKLSDGKYGMMDLMKDLSKVYGKDRSFKDDELFSEIVKLSYPEIGDFLNKYVAGPELLPLAEVFNLVGVDFKKSSVRRELSPLGGIIPAFDADAEKFFITQESFKDINDFGKSMGLSIGDEILKFNGKKLGANNFEKIFENYFSTVKEDDMLKMTIARKDEKGRSRKIKLVVKIVQTDVPVKNILSFTKSPDVLQARLRKAWLGRE